jgi:3-phenylpropionate/trans-cinnamate dioxygenase ferredoxin component
MGLFNTKAQADADGYWAATAVSDIHEGQITAVILNGATVLLLRWQEQLYAVSSKCPHAAADLSAGEFYRGKLECPDHGYVFDVKTGRTLWPEDEIVCLKRYAVKVQDGVVWVKLSPHS